jgi:transposase
MAAKKPAPTGRPTLLTPERARRITDLLTAGNTMETAAQGAGVAPATLYSWIARGRAERDRLTAHHAAKPRPAEARFLSFLEAVEKARADAEANLVSYILAAAMEPKTWQAAAWLLERRDPQKWGRPWRQPVDNDTNTGAVETAVRTLSDGPPLPGEQS